MEVVILVLVLVIAVLISNVIASKITQIPLAFIEIAVGLLMAFFVPYYRHYTMNPELFMLAVLAPLMFYEGLNTNMRALRRSMSTTFSLAVGLALVTVSIVGVVTHLALSELALPLAFALAAIITPTDAVAVSSVTANIAMPEQAMETLKNESLFNDASGIVIFNLALQAFTTGKFSFTYGFFDFLYVFIGGLLLGLVLGSLLVSLRTLLINHRMDNSSVIVTLGILTPFFVYFVAESIHVSGILAVVAAGLVHGVQQGRLRLTSTKLQVVGNTTWEVLSDNLNGFVFVLLGVSLPTVISDISYRNNSFLLFLTGLAALLYAIMTVLRYLWVRFGLATVRVRPEYKNTNSWIIALNGIHGTITLAMAFSLPLTFHGVTFPYRNDLLYIATVVIVLSMLVPSVILPILLPKQKQPYSAADAKRARKQMINYTIKKIKDLNQNPLETQAVIATIHSQNRPEIIKNRRILKQLFAQTRDVENEVLTDLVSNGDITEKDRRLYQRTMFTRDFHLDNSLLRSIWLQISYRFIYTVKRITHGKKLKNKQQQLSHNPALAKKFKSKHELLAQIENQTSQEIFKYLRSPKVNKESKTDISIVQRYYRERQRRYQNNPDSNEIQEELFINAFQFEYNFVQNQLNENKITRELASALYEQISNDELVYMQNDEIYD
ncbi:cation:proton antiporter [Pediococcus sp. M21F004]|uniref:cation:proton antiporter n=1 Tax=Pediococcus sp. M21F004 TaxID=3390033 RepID=UPI003DA72D69